MSLPESQHLKYNMIGTRDDEITKILSETEEGRSVIMNVAKKVKFREKIASFAKNMQLLSGAATAISSIATGAAITGVAGGVVGATFGPAILAAAPIAAAAFVTSTILKNKAQNSIEGHEIKKMTLEQMAKTQDKTFDNTKNDLNKWDMKRLDHVYGDLVRNALHL